jgi:1,4-alpha-glucan branching enzyme
MTSIAPKRPPFTARVRAWLEQHALLGWQVGGMAVAASILMMVLTLTSEMAPPMQDAAIAQNTCSRVVTQNPAAAGNATFCLYAPEAHTVALIGDFNGWGSKQRVELQQQGDALWTVELPLSPGNYQYAFVIDEKKTITDPMAEQHVNDDFGRENAVISVL